MSEDKPLHGVGGWLLLLVILLVVMGPSAGFNNLSEFFEHAESSTPTLVKNAQWISYKAISWNVFSVTTILSIGIGVGLSIVHRSATVTLAIVGLWVLWLLTSFGNTTAAAVISDQDPTAALLEISGTVTGTFITTSLWTAYLLLSRRVKNTFRRNKTESAGDTPPA